MPKFTHHLFICNNQRPDGHPRGCCNPDGTNSLRSAFKEELKKHKLPDGVIRANSAGCLDQCELGPTVVIYPQQIWYGGVTIADVPRIVEETVLSGKILKDLLIPPEALNTKGGRLSPPDAAAGSVDQPI